MTVEISIEEKAKKMLMEKGNVLTISRMDIVSGCMSIEEIDVTYEAPKKRNYEKHTCDQVTIYVQKGLRFKENKIRIVTSGIGPFKTISAGSLDRGIV